jgi:predicted dehydrogenase
MPSKIRVGLIGCGWIALGAAHDLLRQFPRTHYEGLSLFSDYFDVVCLCDNSLVAQENANIFAPGVPLVTRIEELLRYAVDLVVIATPGETHGNVLDVCISAGIRYILCEKPITHDAQEARSILAASRQSGTKIIVNHMRRFSPVIQSAKNYINHHYIVDTAVGEILSGHCYYDKGLFHGGTHLIDLLVYLFGDVKSVTANTCYHTVAGLDGDVQCDVILNFHRCSISLRPFDSSKYAVSDLTLYGDKGRIVFSDMWGKLVKIAGIRQCKQYSAYSELDVDNESVLRDEDSYMTHTYAHLRKVIQDQHPDDSLEASIYTLEIIETIIQITSDGGGTRLL